MNLTWKDHSEGKLEDFVGRYVRNTKRFSRGVGLEFLLGTVFELVGRDPNGFILLLEGFQGSTISFRVFGVDPTILCLDSDYTGEEKVPDAPDEKVPDDPVDEVLPLTKPAED